MIECAKDVDQLFLLGQNERSIALLADEALLIAQSGLNAFVTDELANSIGDDCFIRGEVVAAFVGFAMAFGAYKNLQALVDFFCRDLPEVSEAYIAVGFEQFLVELFVSC